MVPVAFPEIQESFPDTSEATLSWVFTAYTIALASLVVASGRIGDRTGRRRLFLAGGATFVTGSMLAGLSPTAGILIAARAVQGAGHALMIPSSIGLILAAWPPARRTQAVAAWVAVGGTAAALGHSGTDL